MESADRRNKEAKERLEREIREMRARDERLDRDRQKNPDSISKLRDTFSSSEKENMSKSELDQLRNQSKSNMNSGVPTAARGYGSQHSERMGGSNGSTIGNSSQSLRMTMSNPNDSLNQKSEGEEHRNENSNSWPGNSSSIRESRNISPTNSGDTWNVERYDTGWGVSNSSPISENEGQNNNGDVDGRSNRTIPLDQSGYEDRQRNSFERENGEDVWNKRESEFGHREDSSSRYPQNRSNAGESYNAESRETDRGRRESERLREERIDNDDLRKLKNSRAEREDRDRER